MRVYTMMWMLRALWLVVAHDLSEYRYMDDVTRNLFSLFCSTWRTLLKMFMRLFRIIASEAIQERKMEKRGQKELLTYLRMPKLQEVFTTAADRVSSLDYRYETLAIVQNVFAIILLWARKDFEKLFEETVYNQVKRKKKKQRRKVALGT